MSNSYEDFDRGRIVCDRFSDLSFHRRDSWEQKRTNLGTKLDDQLTQIGWTVCVGWLWRLFGERVLIFFWKKKFPSWSWVPFRLLKEKKKRNRFVSSLTWAYCRSKGVSLSPPPRNFTATTQQPTTSSRKFEKVKNPQRWAAYSSLGKIRPSIRWEQKRSDRKRKKVTHTVVPCK